jgi:hypothetical protein
MLQIDLSNKFKFSLLDHLGKQQLCNNWVQFYLAIGRHTGVPGINKGVQCESGFKYSIMLCE